jgi:hypothetical protein
LAEFRLSGVDKRAVARGTCPVRLRIDVRLSSHT